MPRGGYVKLWGSLYLMIWLCALEFLVVMIHTDWDFMVYLHILLGLAIVGLAFYNVQELQKTAAPDRVKRVSKAIAGFSVAQGVIGLLLIFDIAPGIMDFFHIFASLAMITQAASVATGYDMWEEKEFMQIPSIAE
jgi:hypothetical protein